MRELLKGIVLFKWGGVMISPKFYQDNFRFYSDEAEMANPINILNSVRLSNIL